MRLTLMLTLAVAALPAAGIETATIEYEHDGQTYRGVLAHDPAAGEARPLVFVVHEWWGLTEHARNAAVKLAEAGFVGFAVDMYGDGRTTDDAAQAAAWAGPFRQDAQRAVDIMAAANAAVAEHEAVRPGPAASIGFCFGGTVSLELARKGWAPLGAVVSFHGGLGSSVPEDERALTAAVLVHHGAADTMVPQADVEALEAELTQAGVDWQFNAYGGAKHSFTNPKADEYGMDAVGYDAAAAERSWAATVAFLRGVL